LKIGIFLLIFAFVISSLTPNQYLVSLNEVCSCNNSIIYDNVGDFPDYIEIYNSSNSDFDISGFKLSDSKKQLDKFTFPDGTILHPKQYYLLWAGQKPQNATMDDKYLYTNFALRNGENLYLSDKNGKILDKVKIPQTLKCDMSYSRLPLTSIYKQRKPSPLKRNFFSKETKTKFLPDINVTANYQSGFYNDSFLLQLSAPKGFDIFYTLDSSAPNKNSLKYKGPIEIKDNSPTPNKYANIENISANRRVYIPNFKIDKATIVRATAIRQKDGAVGNISNYSYFVGFQNKNGYKDIPVVSIITDPDNLFDYEKGIYITGKLWDMNNRNNKYQEEHMNYWARGREWARPAYLNIFNLQHVLETSDDIQIKINGGYSRHSPQKSFKFELKTSGKRWLLKDGGSNDSERTKISEFLLYELFKNRKGIVYAPQDFVILFLNGEYWGVYVLTPEINESFLSDYFQQKVTDFALIKDGQTDDNNHISFIKNLKSGKIHKVDISTFCDETNINIYDNKSDWTVLKWNSVIYYNKKFDKYFWLLHDLELDPPPEEGGKGLKFPQIYKTLMKNDTLQQACFIAFQDIANYYFDSQKINKLIDEITKKYSDFMVSNFRRFQTEDYTKNDYMAKINVIRDFYKNRFNVIMPYMKNYLNLKGDLIQIHKIPSLSDGGRVLLNTLILGAKEEYLGKYFSDYPISLDVEVFDGYDFKGWIINGKKYDTKQLQINIDKPQTIEAVFEKNSS